MVALVGGKDQVVKTDGQFDLFLDESGTFCEALQHSSKPETSASYPQKFPSQLAGLLVPRGTLTEEVGSAMLAAGLRAVGIEPPKEFHSKDIAKGKDFDGLVQNIVSQFRKRGWQPVRIVNSEKVDYGGRIPTYVNMVAELILRIFEAKKKKGCRSLDLRVTGAIVVVSRDEHDNPEIIEEREYTSRLREYAAFSAIRVAPIYSVRDPAR